MNGERHCGRTCASPSRASWPSLHPPHGHHRRTNHHRAVTRIVHLKDPAVLDVAMHDARDDGVQVVALHGGVPSLAVACGLIIATYHAINIVNYITTRHLHKPAPAGSMVIGACPYPCPPPSVTHANQPPSLWHRHPHSRHPFPPLSLPFFPPSHEKRGRAEARPLSLPFHVRTSLVFSKPYLFATLPVFSIASPVLSEVPYRWKSHKGAIRPRIAPGRIPSGRNESYPYPFSPQSPG